MEITLTSLKVMILGMGTVFIALIGLILIIKALHRFTGKKAEEQKMPSIGNVAFEAEQKMEEIDGAIQQRDIEEESEELVAVITAAVAASLHRSTHDIVVKSIRRVPAITPVWNRISRQEQFAARL